MIAAGRDSGELSSALIAVAKLEAAPLQGDCLQGLRSGFSSATQLALSEPAVQALQSMAVAGDPTVAAAARVMVQILKVETPAERDGALAQAVHAITDFQLPAVQRLAAVAELGVEDDAQITRQLLASVAASTPQVRDAILNAVFSRRQRLEECWRRSKCKRCRSRPCRPCSGWHWSSTPTPPCATAARVCSLRSTTTIRRHSLVSPRLSNPSGTARGGPAIPAELRRLPPGTWRRRGGRSRLERRISTGRGNLAPRHSDAQVRDHIRLRHLCRHDNRWPHRDWAVGE